MGFVMRDKEREGSVQMLPMLQGENCISPVSATGLMMYCELASQVVVDSGQQVIELVSHSPLQEHPSAHYSSREYKSTTFGGPVEGNLRRAMRIAGSDESSI